MVFQRRLDYGFNGYQVPVVPRASRSARGRVPVRKKGETNKRRAFEILACVAGEMLQDSETSNAACEERHRNTFRNAIIWGQKDEGQSLKSNRSDDDASDEKTFTCMPGSQSFNQINTSSEFSRAQDRFSLQDCSTSRDIYSSEMICLADNKFATINYRNVRTAADAGIRSLLSGELLEGQEQDVETNPSINIGTFPITGSLDKSKLDQKPAVLFSSDDNLKSFKNWITLGPSRYDNIEEVSKDDDENYFGCNQIAATLKAIRSSRDVDERIRKLSASKHWRVAPNLKFGASFKNDGKRKSKFYNWRTCSTRQKSPRVSPSKRRKLFCRSPLSASDGGFCHEEKYSSPDRKSSDETCSAAIGVPFSITSQQATTESRDCNVKLCIKSFKVPELFIEIPATATVGSLKRTVMEAVTATLGDGLHVGVLLQGKKIRDDSKTLLQTGISKDIKHHNVGFTLEPRQAQHMQHLSTENRGLTRHSTSWTLQPGSSNVSPVAPVRIFGASAKSDLDIVPSFTGVSADNSMSSSRSLVAVPAISLQALAVVPFNRRAGHPEFVQRRIRRPFSVLEVEALVQAVEKLGTGRWRDVKWQAFDNAKHRTYVDLKDKWKTLVHTARISPQQRRGEPVPQELLDRVIAAHAYWSQQQAKQQFKTTV